MLGISATPCALRIFGYDEAGDGGKSSLFLPALRHVDATLRRARGEGRILRRYCATRAAGVASL